MNNFSLHEWKKTDIHNNNKIKHQQHKLLWIKFFHIDFLPFAAFVSIVNYCINKCTFSARKKQQCSLKQKPIWLNHSWHARVVDTRTHTDRQQNIHFNFANSESIEKWKKNEWRIIIEWKFIINSYIFYVNNVFYF